MAVQQTPSYIGRVVCFIGFLLLFHSGYSTFERKELHRGNRRITCPRVMRTMV